MLASRRFGVNVARALPRRGVLDHFRDSAPNEPTGRSWYAEELRLKSFEDLHRLWYVLLREKNMLLSVRHDCRKKKTTMPGWERMRKVKDSMARLKTVIGERQRTHKASLPPQPLRKLPVLPTKYPPKLFSPRNVRKFAARKERKREVRAALDKYNGPIRSKKAGATPGKKFTFL